MRTAAVISTIYLVLLATFGFKPTNAILLSCGVGADVDVQLRLGMVIATIISPPLPTTNTNLVAAISSALNRSIADSSNPNRGASSTTTGCTHYPDMSVASSIPCTHPNLISGTRLYVLQHTSVFYNASREGIDGPLIRTNTSNPDVAACSAYWSAVAGVTQWSLAEYNISMSAGLPEDARNVSTSGTGGDIFMLDGSVATRANALFGNSTTWAGGIWGTWLGVLTSTLPSAAADATLRSALLQPKVKVRAHVPWQSMVAFVVAGVLSIAVIALAVVSLRLIGSSWRKLFFSDFSQTARTYRRKMTLLVEEKWGPTEAAKADLIEHSTPDVDALIDAAYEAQMAAEEQQSFSDLHLVESSIGRSFWVDEGAARTDQQKEAAKAIMDSEMDHYKFNRLHELSAGSRGVTGAAMAIRSFAHANEAQRILDAIEHSSNTTTINTEEAPPLLPVYPKVVDAIAATFLSHCTAFKLNQVPLFKQLGSWAIGDAEVTELEDGTGFLNGRPIPAIDVHTASMPNTQLGGEVGEDVPLTLDDTTSPTKERPQVGVVQALLAKFPSTIPFLLISLGFILSTIVLVLIAFGFSIVEKEGSHHAVLLGYEGAGCRESVLWDGQVHRQMWDVPATGICEEGRVSGATSAFSAPLFVKATCRFDDAAGVSRLTISTGETRERCEAAEEHNFTTPLTSDAPTSSSEGCISGASVLRRSSSLPLYLDGLCAPSTFIHRVHGELQAIRRAELGANTSTTISASYTPTTDRYIDDSGTRIRLRIGDDDAILDMTAFGALGSIGLASPAFIDAAQGVSPLGKITTPLIGPQGGYPGISGEHIQSTSSNVPNSALSARGFAFSSAATQNLTPVFTKTAASGAEGLSPLVQSPLRYTGVQASLFDLGQHDTLTINFWLRGFSSTRGYIFAVANDWHRVDRPGSNVILESLSHMLAHQGNNDITGGSGSSSPSTSFEFYSALIIDGPTQILSLKFGSGLDATVSWDLAQLGLKLLDGSWHMVSITSDRTGGWRSFHLATDLKTSFTNPQWHQCVAYASSSKEAANRIPMSTVTAPSGIANSSRLRLGAAVAYIGHGLEGGAAVAAFQVFPDKVYSLRQMNSLGTDSMSAGSFGAQYPLIVGVLMFAIVAIGGLIAVLQLVHRFRVEKAKMKALAALSKEERDQLEMIAKSRALKAGRTAAKAIVSAGGEISRLYTSVRQLSLNVGTGSAVGRLKTIYPQFIAVCQTMAIYLTSWGWPPVFRDFAGQFTFLFSFKFDLHFDAIPSITMPIIQIVLSGALLILAVFLTIHDQKEFYLMALGLTSTELKALVDDEDDTLQSGVEAEGNSGDGDGDEERRVFVGADVGVSDDKSKGGDAYRFRGVKDSWLQNTLFDHKYQSLRDVGALPKSMVDTADESTITTTFVKAMEGEGLAASRTSDVGVAGPTRDLSVRPHTRFRVVPYELKGLSATNPQKQAYLKSERVYTFGLATNSSSAAQTGGFEWKCAEGAFYSPGGSFRTNFSSSISEFVSKYLHETGDRAKGNAIDEDRSNIEGSKKMVRRVVIIALGTHEHATHTSSNWQESAIPNVLGGYPSTDRLSVVEWASFGPFMSKSGSKVGLEVVRGILTFERDMASGEYELVFVKPSGQRMVFEVEHTNTYRCPRHLGPMIPFNARFHGECTTCSNSAHDDCRTYLKLHKKNCTRSISLVCKEPSCGYCLCRGPCTADIPILERVMQRLHGYSYTFWHSNINYIIGFFILIIGQSLFLPVMQSAAMIATCHVDYQCDFPRCYEQMSIKYGVALYFSFLTVVVSISVMIPFFTVMILRRKLFLLENEIVPCPGDFDKMSLFAKVTAEIGEDEWNLFLLKDNSMLRALYEMYEFRFVAIHGVFLLFKLLLLLSVVVMERDSMGQLVMAGVTEVCLLGLLTATDAYINPWMDALARVGSFHQILQVGLVAISRAYTSHEVTLGYMMIGVSVLYIGVLIVVVVHEIVLPFLSARVAAREVEARRQASATAVFWIDAAFTAIQSADLTISVSSADYFGRTVLAGLEPSPQTAISDLDREFLAHELAELRRCSEYLEANGEVLNIAVSFDQCVNRALLSSPLDPTVFTALADRLRGVWRLDLYGYSRKPHSYYETVIKRAAAAAAAAADTAASATTRTTTLHNSPPIWFVAPSAITDEDQHLLKYASESENDRHHIVYPDKVITRSGSMFVHLCPGVIIIGSPLQHLSAVDLRRHAVELDDSNAHLYYALAQTILTYQLPTDTITIKGRVMSVGDVLACAVEREPTSLLYTRALVEFLMLLMRSLKEGGREQCVRVHVLGLEMDVLQLCEDYVHRQPGDCGGYELVARTMWQCRQLGVIFEDPTQMLLLDVDSRKSSELPPSTPQNRLCTPSGRPVRIHGRVVHDPKDIMVFVIEVLRLFKVGAFITLAEALVAEENAQLSGESSDATLQIPGGGDDHSDSGSADTNGVVRLFGRECSSVDILGLATAAFPQNYTVWLALLRCMARVTHPPIVLESRVDDYNEGGHGDDESPEGGFSGSEEVIQNDRDDTREANPDQDDGDDDESPERGFSGSEEVIQNDRDDTREANPDQDDGDDDGVAESLFDFDDGDWNLDQVVDYSLLVTKLQYGLYSKEAVSQFGLGRITTETTTSNHSPASWVLEKLSCTTSIDVAARLYFENCHTDPKTHLDVLYAAIKTRVSRLIPGDTSFEVDSLYKWDFIVASTEVRHPLQVKRLVEASWYSGGPTLPPMWTFLEIIEHAIALHPRMSSLYNLLWEWEWHVDHAYTPSSAPLLVLPQSEARRAVTGDDGDRCLVPLLDMWGVLMEHDWCNPYSATFFAAWSPPPLTSLEEVTASALEDLVDFRVRVYLPQEAAAVVPMHSKRWSSSSLGKHSSSADGTTSPTTFFIVDLNAVDARWMALHLGPRDTALNKYTIAEMQRYERRRLRLARHALEHADLDEAEAYVRSHCAERGVLCYVQLLRKETNEVMHFDASDVGSFVTELTRGADPSTLTVYMDYYTWRFYKIGELGALASMATQSTALSPTPPDHNDPCISRARKCLFELLYGRVESWCGGDASTAEVVRSLACGEFMMTATPCTPDMYEAQLTALGEAVAAAFSSTHMVGCQSPPTQLQIADIHKRLVQMKACYVFMLLNQEPSAVAFGSHSFFSPCSLFGVARSSQVGLLASVAEVNEDGRANGAGFLQEAISMNAHFADESWNIAMDYEPEKDGNPTERTRPFHQNKRPQAKVVLDGVRGEESEFVYMCHRVPFVVVPSRKEPTERDVLANCRYMRSPIDGLVVYRPQEVRDASVGEVPSPHPQVLLLSFAELLEVIKDAKNRYVYY